jgi:hypothetical protein
MPLLPGSHLGRFEVVSATFSLSVAGWWTQQQARAWWALHEPELLEPA